ncbi:MAG: DedA family protein [Solirubrobacterales bacterium]
MARYAAACECAGMQGMPARCGTGSPRMFIASISEPVINFATDVVGDLGLPGIFGLMVADAACIPTSSEAVMLFAGFEVSDGRFSLFEVIVAGVAGNLVGSWIAYGVGYYGRVELIEKHGKWLHISPKHLAWADSWFERHGGATVFFTRMIPVIRTFISLPAGVARMPFWKFTWLTLAGLIPWMAGFAIAGKELGDNWEPFQEKLHYLDYAIVAAILAWLVYLVIRRRRGPGDAGASGESRTNVERPAPDTPS